MTVMRSRILGWIAHKASKVPRAVSVIFTATDDIHATFPATAARKFGLGDVPLICARELDIEDGTPMCIRVLMHIETERGRGELHHVYLEGARNLRDDLPA